MADRDVRSAGPSLGRPPVRETVLLVLWAVVVGLFANEYVGSQVTIGATVLSLALGGVLAIATVGWLRYTRIGRGATRWYEEVAFGPRRLVAILAAIIGSATAIWTLVFVGISTVIAQPMFLGGLLGYWWADAAMGISDTA